MKVIQVLDIMALLDYINSLRHNIIRKDQRRKSKICETLSSLPIYELADPKLYTGAFRNPKAAMHLTGPFEVSSKGNQYALMVHCMLTNYVL